MSLEPQPAVPGQIAGRCPKCRTHVIAQEVAHTIYNDGPSAPDWRFSILLCTRCLEEVMVMYGEDGHSFDDPTWVFPRTDDFSGRIPERLRRELSQARDLALAGHSLPAVLMCGRVLEGLAHAHHINEHTLVRSIEMMHKNALIPVEMLEWANELRALRNIAAHFSSEYEITNQDADDALALTEAILDYIYVFTERFQAFKRRRRPERPQPSATTPATTKP